MPFGTTVPVWGCSPDITLAVDKRDIAFDDRILSQGNGNRGRLQLPPIPWRLVQF